MKHLKALIGFLVLVVLAASWSPASVVSSQTANPAKSSLAAALWYVATSGNDSNTCSSPAAPCATINAAIGKASPGDTVYVAEGTYTGEGTEVVLIDKNITLSGGWNSDFTVQIGMSSIDGQGLRVGITSHFGLTADIEGFVIRNGYGSYAGGIVKSGGTMTLTNSTVSGNHGDSIGGGIYNQST